MIPKDYLILAAGPLFSVLTGFLANFLSSLVLEKRRSAKKVANRDDEESLLLAVRQKALEDLKNLRKSIPGGCEIPIRRKWVAAPASFGPKPDPNSDINEIFESADRSLLILGGKGSGKTLLLLQLCSSLIERAWDDRAKPIPVLVNVSSWAADRGSFKNWLIRELKDKYNFKTEVGLSLVERHRLLPMLDGFDELPEKEQVRCAEGIHRYLAEAVGIVVGCGVNAYERLGVELPLNGAICIEPLRSEEVDNYVRTLGPELLTLRGLLESDSSLKEFSESLLFLNLMITVGESFPSERLIGDKRHLFNLYIALQMLSSQQQAAPFSAREVVEGLSWVARKTKQNSESELAPERLQPTWLIEPEDNGDILTKGFASYLFGSRIIGSLIVVLIGVLIMWFSKFAVSAIPSSSLTIGSSTLTLLAVEQRLWTWVAITGILGGATIAIIDWVYFYSLRRSEAQGASRNTTRSDIKRIALNVFCCGIVFFIAASILIDLRSGIQGGVIYGVAFGLVFWFRDRGRTIATDIEMGGKLKWSWAAMGSGALGGLVTAAAVSLVGGLIIAMVSGWRVGRDLSILGFFSGGIIGAVVNGLRRVSVAEEIESPNRGVRVSLRNFVLVSVCLGIPLVLVFCLYGILVVGVTRSTLEAGLFFGLAVGMLVGSAYAGFNFIYHFVLRGILRLKGLPSVRYMAFLEYAHDLTFLRRVGGSYAFQHDSWREHFATLTDEEKRSISSQRGQRGSQSPKVGLAGARTGRLSNSHLAISRAVVPAPSLGK
jgi:hypothetical protein